MIKAVIFDFDGVLGDTMQDNCRAWQESFAEYGFKMDSEEYFQLEGMGRYQIARHFISKYKMDPVIEKDVVEKKEAYYRNNNSFRLYTEVPKIFDLLRSKGISVAIVTGASKDRISTNLDKDIAEQLKALITADDVKNTKPDPEPYQKAVNKMSLRPDECLVIENAILGIESAKAAGCSCFALETTLKAEFLRQADEVFSSHKDLLTKFETMFH